VTPPLLGNDNNSMSEEKMPAAEASEEVLNDDRFAYELAFHILPTVAEGEVPTVFDGIKTAITKTGAEIFDEESPERFDLAYEIVKHLEGKNRKFRSAYFGWTRFRVEASKIDELVEVIEGNKQILRHIIIRLTRVEEESPFRFHEALEDQEKKVVDVEVDSKPEPKAEEKAAEEVTKEKEDVSEKELDKALEEKEV